MNHSPGPFPEKVRNSREPRGLSLGLKVERRLVGMETDWQTKGRQVGVAGVPLGKAGGGGARSGGKKAGLCAASESQACSL